MSDQRERTFGSTETDNKSQYHYFEFETTFETFDDKPSTITYGEQHTLTIRMVGTEHVTVLSSKYAEQLRQLDLHVNVYKSVHSRESDYDSALSIPLIPHAATSVEIPIKYERNELPDGSDNTVAFAFIITLNNQILQLVEVPIILIDPINQNV